MVPVLLAVGGGLADDALDLLELGEVDVAVAVQVEHAESDLELPPGKKGEAKQGPILRQIEYMQCSFLFPPSSARLP